ncbi:hypothetical protein GGS24DRAFT_513001 [Hypoxylon argillaceum]|nr:hypothetical protein GGS24DRAFT_513001 [Hypoxylon argillaceum]
MPSENRELKLMCDVCGRPLVNRRGLCTKCNTSGGKQRQSEKLQARQEAASKKKRSRAPVPEGNAHMILDQEVSNTPTTPTITPPTRHLSDAYRFNPLNASVEQPSDRQPGAGHDYSTMIPPNAGPSRNPVAGSHGRYDMGYPIFDPSKAGNPLPKDKPRGLPYSAPADSRGHQREYRQANTNPGPSSVRTEEILFSPHQIIGDRHSEKVSTQYSGFDWFNSTPLWCPDDEEE